MDAIHIAALAKITGAGSSSSTTNLPYYSRTTSTTDYQTCADMVSRMTAQEYPSTKSWWNPFSTDTNAPTRAAATIQNLGSTCGTPSAS